MLMSILFMFCLTFSFFAIISLFHLYKIYGKEGDLDITDKFYAVIDIICICLWTLFYHLHH